MIELFNTNSEQLLSRWRGSVEPLSGISPWTTSAELAWLAEAASQAKTPVIGEVGSYKGKSALALAAGFRENESISTGGIYCIDRFQDGTEADFRRNTEPASDIITLIVGESGEVAETFHDRKIQFDLFFIDASHAKEDVVRDIELWTPFVSPGGILCGHDCYPGEPENGIQLALAEKLPRYTLAIDSIWCVRIPE